MTLLRIGRLRRMITRMFLLLALAALLFQSPCAQAQVGGIYVDAKGVLHWKLTRDPNGSLSRERKRSAKVALGQLAANSKLRKISLNRLEKALEKVLKTNGQPKEDMLLLAGLTRLQYVFFFPETKDIVIAGPAEGWATDQHGVNRGIESGRPVLELQDLIIALRAFAPDSDEAPVISCSIDPTTEGLARMQQFLKNIGPRATPRNTRFIVEGLQKSLGLQKVTLGGVPPRSHFAQIMVSADYRMKLIGIGLEKAPVKMKSYVDLVNPAQVARNAMQRWYFTPDYKAVRVSEDELAMELVGNGVKLIGADELVTRGGKRLAAGSSNRASEMFVTAFTKKYPEIAAKSPLYAQLRNLIDLSIAAAYIQQHDFYEKAQWKMETFSDEKAYSVETFNVPLQVATAVNAIWRGNTLMTPIGGGVRIEPLTALDTDNLLEDKDGKVDQSRKQSDLSKLKPDQWWWD